MMENLVLGLFDVGISPEPYWIFLGVELRYVS